MKEFLFQINKKLSAFFDLKRRKMSRMTAKNTMSIDESYRIPIIINNYNRYTYMLQLITWLENNGYTNIVILDNDSTYPPLLDYYKTTKHKIIYLKKNVGYKALWQTNVFDQFKREYYVYTDPDVAPNEDCPGDVIFQLYSVLKKHNTIEKCGPALSISDLPDHYDDKTPVIKWEHKHWQNKIENDVFDAPIDTTFALYRPFARGEAELCKAYRLGGKYTFRHLPWYVNSKNLPAEELFYKNSINKTQSHWMK